VPERVRSSETESTFPEPGREVGIEELWGALIFLRDELRATRGMFERVLDGLSPIRREEFLQANGTIRQELLAIRESLQQRGEQAAPMSREEFLEATESLRQDLLAVRESSSQGSGEGVSANDEELLEAIESLREDLVAARETSAKRSEPAPLSRQEFFQAHGLLRNELLGTLAKLEETAGKVTSTARDETLEDLLDANDDLLEELAAIRKRLQRLVDQPGATTPPVTARPPLGRPVMAPSETSAWSRPPAPEATAGPSQPAV
jgi:hypothetical protein